MERFCHILPNTESGLRQVLTLTVSYRRAGCKTFVRRETLIHFPVYRLTMIPAPRPNRRARGCDLMRP
jgi:hypothetical protein